MAREMGGFQLDLGYLSPLFNKREGAQTHNLYIRPLSSVTLALYLYLHLAYLHEVLAGGLNVRQLSISETHWFVPVWSPWVERKHDQLQFPV